MNRPKKQLWKMEPTTDETTDPNRREEDRVHHRSDQFELLLAVDRRHDLHVLLEHCLVAIGEEQVRPTISQAPHRMPEKQAIQKMNFIH